MADWGDRESPDELVLRHALEKLRARDGLTLARLQREASGVANPLVRLAAVQRYASTHNIGPARAALSVVAECVRDALSGTDRLVADAVLALGVTAEAHQRHGIDPRVVDALCADLLSRRRRTLLANWELLHRAVEADPGEVPSDRALRGTTEQRVLAELARQLIRREVLSAGSASVVVPVSGDAPPADRAPNGTGRVIVVGGAVMDATFHTKTLPQLETSGEAYGFTLSPGGKGLTQAIAAARLGLEVSLVAAVADDRFGHDIVAYLEHEHVDTSLMKIVPDARTPFTGVIELELGDSVAVNWRNEREVRLDIRDIERLEPQLRRSDAVLITFELPRDSMQRTINLVHRSPERADRPLIIVTPGQPYTDGNVSGQALAEIDYLVANAWELGRYAPPGHDKFDLDAVARRLLAYGVETLCVPTGGGCTIYTESLGTFSVPTFTSTYKESSAARDAFCAALAAKLIEVRYAFSAEVALWATAAMAAAIADYPLPNSMPDRRRVDQLLSRSRFIVAPRASDNGLVSDAADGASPRAQAPSPD